MYGGMPVPSDAAVIQPALHRVSVACTNDADGVTEQRPPVLIIESVVTEEDASKRVGRTKNTVEKER